MYCLLVKINILNIKYKLPLMLIHSSVDSSGQEIYEADQSMLIKFYMLKVTCRKDSDPSEATAVHNHQNETPERI